MAIRLNSATNVFEQFLLAGKLFCEWPILGHEWMNLIIRENESKKM